MSYSTQKPTTEDSSVVQSRPATVKKSLTVGELIERLRQFPDDMPVVLAGYEGGFNDPLHIRKVGIKRDANRESWMGQHEEAASSDAATTALCISGHNQLSDDGEDYVR